MGKSISIRSRILVLYGKIIYGNPERWGIDGLDCTAQEFYALEEDRPVANQIGSLEPQRVTHHKSMVRNLKVSRLRDRANIHITLFYVALAILLIVTTQIYFMGNDGIDRGMSLNDELRNIKTINKKEISNEEKSNTMDGLGNALIQLLKSIR